MSCVVGATTSWLRTSAVICAMSLCLGMTLALAQEPELVTPGREGRLIGSVAVSPAAFDPSLGQKVQLVLVMREEARVSVRVYDADWRQIALLADALEVPAGELKLDWNGTDRNGEIVADDAYFFTVDAQAPDGQVERFDPTVFSGGEEGDITDADIDPVSGTVVYRLPVMARVSIRIGITGGPLLRTLVDWKPRTAGIVTEFWDGKDVDGLIDINAHPDKRMIITYFALPETSVIAFGNKNPRASTRSGPDWPRKPGLERAAGDARKISPHYRIERRKDVTPVVDLEFPSGDTDENGVPVLSGRSIVRVHLDEASRRLFQDSKFEIVFFVDGKFYSEEEVGYTPYNWVWDTTERPDGDYLLTVNVSSFTDQIGVRSARVSIRQ